MHERKEISSALPRPTRAPNPSSQHKGERTGSQRQKQEIEDEEKELPLDRGETAVAHRQIAICESKREDTVRCLILIGHGN